MSQQVQELIDKIKSEGVAAAEDKAKEIETQAESKAKDIVAGAQSQAEQIIAEAKQKAQTTQQSTEMALKQSSRDMLLSLRKKIEQSLQKIISAEVDDALTSENLSNILTNLSNKFFENKDSNENIFVTLSDEDLSSLKDGFIAKLKEQLKQPITFQSSDDVSKGFAISFDSGKSAFDFTDASLAEYLGLYLNEHVASLLKDAV
ncbi:hypothetical protein MNBD_UNCLBAC01-725 [hydrothermal vent metagenome]|uniref:V-type ATP synthase subunit E n=1 Tax=hydrothermal vent metagenome TaxID=652676 RepID=A0A3B1DBA6_9ZZZZ